MQTFMPYSMFAMSLECLDDKRLGKQRVEAMQIYNVLTGKSKKKGWRNHPAVLMWKGYEKALALYYNCALYHWGKRGFRNIKLKPIKVVNVSDVKYPPWIGNERFHLSHMSNLLRKNPKHYDEFRYFGVTRNLPYVWPTKEGMM